MINRRRFLRWSSFGFGGMSGFGFRGMADQRKPLVLSTWAAGLEANKAAWKILSAGGLALDAVEAGVRVTEASQNCCVGLGGNPDRDGFVTLDACIMDHTGNCGSVVFLERIKHPVSVARRVMEKTPHVMLAGEGAQKFAINEGFPLETSKLSPEAEKAYENWLKQNNYQPGINRENQGHGPFAPGILENGDWNHDTIGMIALDEQGRLSGSCTTSGMGFKMRGRIGDSPIIGAGLYVDGEVGAAVATGQGEDIIRICGAHTIVEYMRNNLSPEEACKKTMERLLKIKGLEKAKQIQAGFIAINHKGEYGGFALQKGFNFAVCYADNKNILIDAKSMI